MSGQLAPGPLFRPGLRVLQPLKSAMRQALKDRGLSREQVVDLFNLECETAGDPYNLSLAKLESWVAPSKPNVIPVHLLPIFCKITGSHTPIQVLAAPLGLLVAGQEEQTAMRAGYALAARRRANREYNLALTAVEELKS